MNGNHTACVSGGPEPVEDFLKLLGNHARLRLPDGRVDYVIDHGALKWDMTAIPFVRERDEECERKGAREALDQVRQLIMSNRGTQPDGNMDWIILQLAKLRQELEDTK
jgi:hypothetical protein